MSGWWRTILFVKTWLGLGPAEDWRSRVLQHSLSFAVILYNTLNVSPFLIFFTFLDAFRASIIYQGTENTLIEEGVKKWLWKATRRKLRGDEKKKKNEKLRLLKKGEKENMGEGGAHADAAAADDAGGSDIEAAGDGIIELAVGGNIYDIEDF